MRLVTRQPAERQVVACRGRENFFIRLRRGYNPLSFHVAQRLIAGTHDPVEAGELAGTPGLHWVIKRLATAVGRNRSYAAVAHEGVLPFAPHDTAQKMRCALGAGCEQLSLVSINLLR